MNKKSVKYAYLVICELREEYANGGIMCSLIMPLVNLRTGQETGYDVIIYLANKFENTDAVLNDWKKRLNADKYSVTAKHNQLKVKFTVHYEK